MMAERAGNKVISQELHLSKDAALRIPGATFLHTKHIRCPLVTNKYNKHTETVLRMSSAQKKISPARRDRYRATATKYREHPS